MNIRNLFKQRKYIAWDAYINKIVFIEDFYWQQGVRKGNIKNL